MAKAHTNYTAEPKAQHAEKIIHLIPGEKQVVFRLCANNSHRPTRAVTAPSRRTPGILLWAHRSASSYSKVKMPRGSKQEDTLVPVTQGNQQSSFGSYCIMEFVIGKKSSHGHFLLWVFLNVNSPYAFPTKTAHAVRPSPATLTGPLWCLLSFRRTVR